MDGILLAYSYMLSMITLLCNGTLFYGDVCWIIRAINNKSMSK